MALQSLNIIKKWFKTGLKPTQNQFWDTWDSFWHKSEQIPISKIDGVMNIYNSINECALDNDVVHKLGNLNETVTGLKKFQDLAVQQGLTFLIAENIIGKIEASGSQFDFIDDEQKPIFRASIRGFTLVKNGLYECNFSHFAISENRNYLLPNKSGTLALENTVNGSFITSDKKTVTVVNGLITSVTF